MKNTRFQACLAARGGINAPYPPRQNGRIVARAPLSDLQYAYLLGELGEHPPGGPALFYSEYACERLDVIALSRALYQLMSRHEMLRATFDASGMLRVHSSLPVPLSYLSLRGQSDEVCRRRLAASRAESCRQGTPLVGGAPFGVRVFTLDDETIVQVVGRMLAMDGFSTEIFGQDLRALLAGEQLPSLNYSFREYRDDAERRKDLPDFTAARAYWLSRLDSLPAGPQLPQRRPVREPDPQLNRREFTLPADLWVAFANAAVKHRLTPTAAVGAAFSQVIRLWAEDPHFTINIVCSGRPAAPSGASQVIGSFDNAVLLECAPDPHDHAFVDSARMWHRQLFRDLRHSAFSGASVIRELNQRTGGGEDAVAPVVVASLLGTGDGSAGAFLGHLGWEQLDGAVCIPQVSLSHQAHLADGELVVQWDTADDIFPPGMVDDMFAGYRSLLTRLATSDGAWHGE